jgi:hypothetical protein
LFWAGYISNQYSGGKMNDEIDAASRDNSLDALKKRLGDLNTKGYYLLVALSFLYFRGGTSGISLQLKLALTLTSLAAVLPLQDFFKGKICWLLFALWFKVFLLSAALLFTLWWIWHSPTQY